MNPTTNTEAGAVADVAAIARGLTKAQRKAIRSVFLHTPTSRWRCDGVMHPCDRNLRGKGLVNGIYNELTPLGIAVRQHLEQGATAS